MMKELKEKLYIIIFEHDTKGGKLFDVVLILMILLSVISVMLETVEYYWIHYSNVFFFLEWFFTLSFTLELILRLYSTDEKKKYLLSFYGFVDVVSIIPTYLAVIIPGAQAFMIVRAMRLLRLFRILKLSRYTIAGSELQTALVASRAKIIVFLFFITTIVTLMGAAMFYIESPESGFTSIPTSIYWAIVTMTTVGYGDITPVTTLGKFLSACLMLLGYGVIAVPTGIITSEMTKAVNQEKSTCQTCSNNQNLNSRYCSDCGRKLKD
jgi:voltage-gated potassium channel